MGLLTETLEVKINTNTYKHYEDLGYEIPRHYNEKKKKWVLSIGERITVKATDLYENSGEKVDCQCDNCKKIMHTTYQNYTQRILSDKFLCKSCYHKICLTGENHPMWNDNLTDEDRIIGRNYPEYKEFIKKVLIRDNYTCFNCGIETHHRIAVHHLDGYDWCEEKRIDETNAVCLCQNCHSNFHAHYGMGNNTKEQFEEWIGYSIETLNKYDGKLSPAREVVCLEDEKIYASCLEASRFYHVDSHQINFCCNQKGGYLSVQGLHFMWLQEYQTLTDEEIKLRMLRIPKKWRSVICITTNKVFKSASEAARFYNMKRGNDKILKVCNKERKSAGHDPITNEKLVWKYYDLVEDKILEEWVS